MSNDVTTQAWAFDPGFQAYNYPSSWNGSNISSPPNSYYLYGPSINLSTKIREVTFSDNNENGSLAGGTGDSFTVNGTKYTISQVYNGDRMRVDGQWYETVTFYGTAASGNWTAVTLPIVDGNIAPAFSGGVNATTYLLTPNSVNLPITSIPCFTSGTLILTDRGYVVVDDLNEGDLVMTRDEGLLPIRWIGSRIVNSATLAAHPNLRPIRIRAAALGHGLPTSDLVVSPQHRILVRSPIALRLFGTDEVLVAAKQLLPFESINVADDIEEVEYFHFLLDDHHIVTANGADTESLYTGPQALKSVGAAALEEIFVLFPQLKDRDPAESPDGARMLLTGCQARILAHRHAKNSKPLVI